MKTNEDQKADALDKCLREWRVSTPLPPRFEESVWRRIEKAETSGESSLWLALQSVVEKLIVRPRLALSYATAALALGLVLGFWQARQDAAAQDSTLGQRYVQSVNPYLKLGQL